MMMVANSFPTLAKFVPPPTPLVDGRWRVVQFTRADAESLVRQGMIPEDATTELLSGIIVLKDRSARGEDPIMIGRDHTLVVELLSDLRTRINTGDRHVRSQQPLVCSEIHVPEPDFMVLRGTLASYVDLATASDAFCVLEVSDASYARDAGEKLVNYARAGVVQYVILNLITRTAEVYSNPDAVAATYPAPQIIAEDEELQIRIGNGAYFSLTLRNVLP